MTPTAFCYWLQGFFELSDAETLSPKQVEAIKNHLNLVFEHVIDPSYTSHLGQEDAQKIQAHLNEVHKPTGAAHKPSGASHGPVTYRC